MILYFAILFIVFKDFSSFLLIFFGHFTAVLSFLCAVVLG